MGVIWKETEQAYDNSGLWDFTASGGVGGRSNLMDKKARLMRLWQRQLQRKLPRMWRKLQQAR